MGRKKTHTQTPETPKPEKQKHYITEAQRYQIEILLKEKYTKPQIAKTLGISYHTLWHEVKRGTVKQLDTQLKEYYVYKADYAQRVYAQSVANRGRNLKIGADHQLAAYIETMVKNHYSPEALLLHARNEGLQFQTTLCPKTIYNYFDLDLFLHAHVGDLPTKRKKKKKTENQSTVSLNNRKGRSISGRPKEVQKRDVYGHWEMDTVASAKEGGGACLLVLSERMTREEIVVKLRDKKGASVVRALNRLERQYGSQGFREKFQTITCDNGVEFLNQEGIERSCLTKRPRTTLYYCHPYSAYERGTNENSNRLIRRFFPKGTDFSQVTPKQVQFVADWMNRYPRKLLGGLSSLQFREARGLPAA